jgi:hypothetical protein
MLAKSIARPLGLDDGRMVKKAGGGASYPARCRDCRRCSPCLRGRPGPITGERQRLQGRLFFGEGLIDDALRGRVHAGIGDRIEPMLQLGVEIIEITKGAAVGKVLADVTERPFHFAFGLRPVRPASAWLKAIVPGEIDKRAIIDDEDRTLA